MPNWDPNQYLKFAGHRLRPALDLLARITADGPRTVFDLGCGTGSIARILKDRWPNAHVIGIDGSETMLDKARAEHPDLRFETADLNAWATPQPAGILYSNAALHWLDNHAELFPRLIGQLERDGVLAVQMPRNHAAPSLACMTETALNGPWSAKLKPILRPNPVAEPAVYYDLLRPLVTDLEIWETVYIQALEGDNPVVEWTKGTALRPLLEALDDAERDAFLADYGARVVQAYPRQRDGRTLFPFRRLFIVATGRA